MPRVRIHLIISCFDFSFNFIQLTRHFHKPCPLLTKPWHLTNSRIHELNRKIIRNRKLTIIRFWINISLFGHECNIEMHLYPPFNEFGLDFRSQWTKHNAHNQSAKYKINNNHSKFALTFVHSFHPFHSFILIGADKPQTTNDIHYLSADWCLWCLGAQVPLVHSHLTIFWYRLSA